MDATIVTGGDFWGMKKLTQDQDPRRMTVVSADPRLLWASAILGRMASAVW